MRLWFAAFLLAGSLQADAWLDTIAQGNRRLDQGHYRDAVAQYELALAAADSPAHRADTLYHLALAHGKLAEYVLAEQFYKQALAIFRAEGDSSRLALSLAGLGEIYRNEYRPEQALMLERRNLTVLEQIGRRRSAEAGAILNITGAILFEERRFKEAESDMREALDILSKASGPESPDVALVLNNLGAVALARGRLSEAEALIMRSLAIRRARFGPDHPLIAGAMLGLASVYTQQRRYSEADRFCRDSIRMMSLFLSPNHPELMKARTHLAIIAHDAGNPISAIGVLEDAVAGAGNDRSAISFEYLHLLNLYSRYLDAMGQKEKARRIHDKSREAIDQLNRPSEANATVAIGELAAGDLHR